MSGTKITSMAGMTNIGGMSEGGAGPFADNLRCGGGGIGSHRRLERRKQCAEAGLKVALLEAGRAVESQRVYRAHRRLKLG